MKVENIEYRRVHVDELQTFERNPRRGDVARIGESLRQRGQYRPLVVNRGTHTGRAMEVLAGNHTLAAARSIGMTHVDVGIVDVDEQAARSIVVADNRLADLGDYDEKTLADLLSDLEDLTGTGYSDADLEALLAAQELPAENTDRDDAPPMPDTPPVSAPGDVYELGPHRVVCGDSTDPGVYEALLGDVLADCVWTDPPYGVAYVGKTGDALTIENDADEDAVGGLVRDALSVASTFCRGGAPVYMASPQGPLIHDFQQAFIDAGLLWRQNLVWVKNAMILGRSDYHYKHEPIMYGETGDHDSEDALGSGDDRPVDSVAPHGERHEPVLYGFTPGGSGRLGRGGARWYGDNKQTTVFEFPKPARNGDHPTMKPVDLVLAMLRNSCPPGGVVLDVFGGSGSTLIAAHHLGAKARLIELDPRYVDVICKRWQLHTGVTPIRDGEEVSFL
ncbi:DNA methyltransferase [Corynebacterium imitans]|uniref:DNA methyltransferase n=1 Tax=Corynebacterium imitans TaxID=156978 RepID=UPI00255149EB|nr:DNA methyltransferase [Corynebacterium imitans]MDK8637521.1 DNA methyltransferase [Corynebacterium imitans]MDK8772083.1 DNA methyltransferase [Corynebacterium imitans]